MSEFVRVAVAVNWRNFRNALARPILPLIPMFIPLVFFATFAGGLSALGRAPGFDFPSGYTSFQFVFVLIQGSAFQGMFIGFFIARDFESGFARRLLLSSPSRGGVLLGYLLTAGWRSAAGLIVLFTAGLAVGMQIDGSFLEIVLLGLLGIATSVIGALWASGVALRLRTVQAAPLMQVPVFFGLFLAPVFVPKALLAGWIKRPAEVNPFTVFLEEGRAYISGQSPDTLLAFGVAGGLVVALTVWSVLGLRRAARSS